MNLLQAIILGIVQGLTEFLPISSSAHLVIVPFLLNWQFPEEQVFVFDVLVQLGTLVAVIVYFRKDLWNIAKAFITSLVHRKPFETADARLAWWIILATLPAVVVGLLVKGIVEQAFSSPLATGCFLLGTAGLLALAEWKSQVKKDLNKATWIDALVIGLFQVVSLFPGVSRSGATITGGMLSGLHRREAARFSFLMSVPVMLGAGLLGTLDLLKIPGLAEFLPMLLVGMATAAIIGYIAIHWLLRFLTHHRLYWFALYCLVIGLGVILIYVL
jgi:undecaprenyl-diphosphatase